MFSFLWHPILLSTAVTIASLSYGQTNDTSDWNTILQQSIFREISSIKKVNKNILAKFPSWKKISKHRGQFNPTDLGGGRRLRLFFVARTANHWIISYEHGGRGYHTHCYLITIDSQNNLDIRESEIKFESLDYLKALAKTDQNLFSQWRGYEY
ncbi:MAG: hypothetical protein E6H09_05330 [Bacteroidetes bacterium]|jgi:hypothetical protein|nr:MAG: hypothetical protein E6H09_05330 [Bacteroidota bacterium]